MNKKHLLIFASIITTVLIGFIIFLLFNNKVSVPADNSEIVNASDTFVESWYTYKNQTDSKYLEKVKPLMTEKLYDETEYVHTQRPQDFEGQEASSVDIEDTKLVLVDKNYAEARVKATQKEGKDTISLILSLNLVKEGDKWLVSYFSPSTE